MQYVQEGEHTGTHWGAPAHFEDGGLTADQLSPEDLFLPAVKVDVREQAAADPDYAVTVDDLTRWERRHGRIPRGAARSEEHTSELQSLMRISYAVYCLK